MSGFWKVAGIAGLIVVVVIGLFVLVSFVRHRVLLKEEAERFESDVQRLDVNAAKLVVHMEGDGPVTLVFLSGHGTTHPVLDFKPLWSRLVDQYRIVVVERPGYGWSDITNAPRDVATVLSETRGALDAAGVEGPYVLVPHSMAGLEALYWAQEHPDEVTAIVGLDLVVPEAVELLPEPGSAALGLMSLVSRIGLSRWMPEDQLYAMFPVLSSEALSESEQERYVAAFFRTSYSRPMIEEIHQLSANADVVSEGTLSSSLPILCFISTQQAELVDGWEEALSTLVSAQVDGTVVLMDTGHYLHHEESERLVEDIIPFIERVTATD